MDADGYSQIQLDELAKQMVDHNASDPEEILHLLKVHAFARMIGVGEELDDITLFILEAAAYTHDIGNKTVEEKYGKSDGRLQDQEGPVYAQQLLSEIGLENYMIERICYLIECHHDYSNIDGLDNQILIEADFLVNLYDDKADHDKLENVYNSIFRTETGKELFRQMFDYSEE